ncbi:MAG: hypothetical protein KBT48_11055 [Firmicutes bacterium]|nr:hypothetical protein [Bacillota bacterium]
MKSRLWLGLMSLITFLCLEALTLFGYGYLTDQAFVLTIRDIKFIFVAILLACVFFIWLTNVFLGSRRVIRNRRKRSYRYRMVSLWMSLAAILLVPVTVLAGFGYRNFLDYPGLRPYEKAISKSYYMGYVLGADGLSRHGAWQGDLIVAHAMGGIDNRTYTLSKEAFELNYSKGFRVFELDFSTTLDGDIALCHYWDTKKNGQKNIPTTEQFLSQKVSKKYTPLMLKDFFQYMKEHKDIWVVGDTKEDVASVYATILQEAKEENCVEVLDRFLIQFLDAEQYDIISSIYDFKSYIYGSYMYWDGSEEMFEQICEYCMDHQIDSVSMWNYYCRPDIVSIADRYSLDVYVHSENNLTSAVEFLNMGVRGIYTDFIEPSQLGG